MFRDLAVVHELFRRRKPAEPAKFRRVSPTVHIAEYRGILPASPWAEHHLWCGRIEPESGRQLVGQGFTTLGAGIIPTHSLFCVAKMGAGNPQTRYVFGLYFALSWRPDGSPSPGVAYRDALAERLASKMAISLYQAKLPSFAIRCMSEMEYPWCLAADAFDQHWEIEAGVWYRSLTRISG